MKEKIRKTVIFFLYFISLLSLSFNRCCRFNHYHQKLYGNVGKNKKETKTNTVVMAGNKQSDNKYNFFVLSFSLTSWREIQTSKIRNITVTNAKIQNKAIMIKANNIAIKKNKKSVVIYKKSRNIVNCQSSLSPDWGEF